MFQPCIVIPCYNHGSTMPALLRALELLGLPCIVVDDGSGPETAAVLDELARTHDAVRLVRTPTNNGKGSATIRALREAWSAGYTHALQIDADGQHDTGDVPRMLEEAQAHPTCVISGRPVFDATVPRSRFYGRYITHVLVWVETLSLQIADSMCGYRVYPLAETIALVDAVHVRRRMDFDTDILVRLFRRQVGVRFVPTRVIYPEHGLSNFRMLRDNLLMVRLHVRLLASLSIYIPQVIGRNWVRQRHWTGYAERGSVAGIRIMLWVYRRLGRSAAHALLYPVVAYFWITGHTARHASQTYLRRLRATAVRRGVELPGGLGTYRHLLRFGAVILDRLAWWGGFMTLRDAQFDGELAYQDLAQSGKGIVVIGAHLGDLETCRVYSQQRNEVTVNAMMFTDHSGKFNRVMEAINPNFRSNVIHVPDLGPETGILMQQRIEAGEWVIVVGDRTPSAGNRRVVWADFLGRPAPFPQGPFILAALLRCPVYLMFGILEPDGVRVYLESFADPLDLPRQERDERLKEVVQRYAERLEHYCMKAPLDWFNFFDFWALSEGGAARSEE